MQRTTARTTLNADCDPQDTMTQAVATALASKTTSSKSHGPTDWNRDSRPPDLVGARPGFIRWPGR